MRSAKPAAYSVPMTCPRPPMGFTHPTVPLKTRTVGWVPTHQKPDGNGDSTLFIHSPDQNRATMGYAHPTALRWRLDKPVDEAGTLETLKELLG